MAGSNAAYYTAGDILHPRFSKPVSGAGPLKDCRPWAVVIFDMEAFLNPGQRHQVHFAGGRGEEGKEFGSKHGRVQFAFNGNNPFHNDFLQQQFMVGSFAQIGGKGSEEEIELSNSYLLLYHL